ncbi:MAG: SH3 domain-containing protein [Pseudomonadota bacterium]
MVLAAAGLCASCALPQQQAAETPEPEIAAVDEPAIDVAALQADNALLREQSNSQAFEIRQLKEELAATELRLIAASAQVQRLKVQVEESRIAADDAIAEVVRTQARLRGNVSRADAASNIAEAEVLLAEFSDNSTPQLEKIREQLSAAAIQFEAGNFGGAMYLSNQAKRGLSGAKNLVEALSPVPNEESFGDLVQLWITKDSNLRQGPGLDHPSITVLEEGTEVQGYSYSGAWVRVRVDEMLEGWVFQPLLSQTNPSPQE